MVRLFRVFIPVVTLTLLISEIILIFTAFLVTAYVELGYAHGYLMLEGGLYSIGVVVLTIIIGLYLHDLYSDFRVQSKILLVQQLCFVMGAAFLLQALINYIDRDLRMPLHLMVPGSAVVIVVIYCWRLFFSAYAISAIGGDRLLLVGGSPLLQRIAERVGQRPEEGTQILGVIDDAEPQDPAANPKYLGRLESLRDIVHASRPSRIVVGMIERRNRLPVNDLLDLRFAGNVVEEAAAAYERICGRVPIRELRPSQLIYTGDEGHNRQTVLYQSIANFATALVGLAVTWPLMLLTALAVRLTSAGPVLYRQVRVGKGGEPFTLYKFRSMRMNAEAETGAVWAAKDDPRVTSVGRIIRKIRFDELPQLFNVLKGEMSIVGPRPERPEFVKTLAEQIPYYRQRQAVRPGITGWAQINYKYGDTLEDTITKLEYDLYYIKHMSFSMDAYIIFHTLKAMVLSRGAQ